MPTSVSVALVAAAALLASAAPLPAATLFDPALRFRALPTEHFVVYFHQGEERLARRLAVVAEETWHALRLPLGTAPPPLTHVVLVDQTESANGWAYPLPYNTIVVAAAAPAGSEFIGRADDWLRLVFVHEFTHIVHLDRSEGWARTVRGMFGRMPLAFPNLFLPAWQIEGLATYEESALTGFGRLHAGEFRAIEREAARARAIEPLDRLNGGLTDWPGGLAPYAYGLGFHEYLATRFGADSLATLAAATARSVPYTGSRAFRAAFGQPLGALWDDYRASLTAAAVIAEASLPDDRPTRLTRHGFSVVGPRFAPPACATCSPEIVYSVRTPHDFPALLAVGLDGSSPRRLTTRYLGSTSAATRQVVVFDQQELRRNVGQYSDLIVLDRATGRARPLTTEARLLDPDLSPDGRTIACVQEGAGQRDLVLVRLEPEALSGPVADVAQVLRPAVAGITVLIAEPETQFNTPRWSPDGRSIVVARRRLGTQSDLVVVDVMTREVRPVASDASASIVTPAWRPDGGAIVAAAAFGGDVFNLFEFTPDGSRMPRQLTDTSGGALWPDVSPDGTTIVFVGYTVDGFDLFTIPYSSSVSGAPSTFGGAHDVTPPASPISPQAIRVAPEGVLPASSPYSPWSTLKPTSWSPLLEAGASQLRVGAGISGVDVLAYHSYAASATWRVNAPEGAPAPAAAMPDWQITYAYDRWRPTLFVSASARTSFFGVPATGSSAPSHGVVRERQVEAGVLLPWRRVRILHRAVAAVLHSADRYTPNDRGRESVNRVAGRVGWATTTARTYGFSISRERGITVGASAELTRNGLRASQGAVTLTADVRAYVPTFARHHVLAVRAAGGVSTGYANLRRTFYLGGGAPNADVLDFSRNAFSLLRGFGPDTFAGVRAAVVNVDYRWPVARPQRGVGTWPVFLHTVHAAVFGDVGHVWSRTFRAGDVKTSAGVELAFDLVAGYNVPLTVTLGAGRGRDGSAVVGPGRAFYVRVGRAF